MVRPMPSTLPFLRPAAADAERLTAGEHHEPHAILGAHPAAGGAVVRAFHPDATEATLRVDGSILRMEPLGDGLWAALVPRTPPLDYRLQFGFADGARWERDDPYRFLPTLGELDLHLIGEGT